MDELELHMDINVQVVIPEWLRKKMGLTEVENDARDESEDCDDVSETDDDEPDAKAHEEALAKLAKALRDGGIADISFTYCGSTRDHLKK